MVFCRSLFTEAVVTFPTEEDFTDAPRRLYSDWLKWKKRDPQVKERMMGYLEKMKWDPLFSWNHWNTSPPKQNNAESACFPAKPDHTHHRESAKVAHPELKSKMLASLQWEVSEELIFLLVKEKRLLNPFDEQYWCPISVQLLKKSLHIVADYLIQDKNHCDESNLNILLSLRKKLFDVALEATRAVKAITDLIADSKTDTSSFASYLSFLEKADPSKDIKHHSRYLVVDSVQLSRVSVEDFAKAPQSLDKNWYLISEVIFVTHALASLINWNPYQSTEKTIYSLDEICNAVEINEDASYKLLTPKIRAWGPLITIPIS